MYAVKTAYIVVCMCVCVIDSSHFAFHLAEIFIMTNYKKMHESQLPIAPIPIDFTWFITVCFWLLT